MPIKYALCALIFSTCTAFAGNLDKPEGEVVLTVSGSISETNMGATAQFDRAMLDALGTVEVETSTIWTDGVHKFEGVEIATLLRALGVTSGTLRATAVNDYSIEIPVSEAAEGGPILASRRDGKEMSLRDKGPLWVIYPYDQNEDFRTEAVYSRSIWQLDRIEVVN
ncbi:oxidoreductase [Hoeflea sp. AS60]|uniref:oxidoreductase n=1 Tax=Hoeflea sp. AS60 TaxID=3135780 RepID=UPI0031717CAC